MNSQIERRMLYVRLPVSMGYSVRYNLNSREQKLMPAEEKTSEAENRFVWNGFSTG